MGTLLSKSAIFGANDLKTQDVDVPEWGGTVRVKALTGIERDQFESNILDQNGKDVKVNMANARARLVSMAVIDGAGEPLFAESDIAMLGTKSAAALDRVYGVAAKLAGIDKEDMAELTGNSKATASAGSPSA